MTGCCRMRPTASALGVIAIVSVMITATSSGEHFTAIFLLIFSLLRNLYRDFISFFVNNNNWTTLVCYERYLFEFLWREAISVNIQKSSSKNKVRRNNSVRARASKKDRIFESFVFSNYNQVFKLFETTCNERKIGKLVVIKIRK